MLRWERDTRYYKACLTVDLFGQFCVIYTWGGIGLKGGQWRTIPCDDLQQAKLELRKIFKRRKSRNYKLFP